MKFIENQYALNSGHCEERSDAAIQRSLVEKGPGLLRFARNGGIKLNVFGILVLVFSALLLSACGEDKAPELSVLYSTDVTVVQGNEVIFDRAAIGTVEKVAGDGDGSRVTLSISADKLAMLHEGSAAMMTRPFSWISATRRFRDPTMPRWPMTKKTAAFTWDTVARPTSFD